MEELLDARRLPIVVASPTLAQGVDLACSVLLFRSLQRYEGGKWVSIRPAEFSNVVGRAGRAYVDLDGIVVLPTFEAARRDAKHGVFGKLIAESRGQRLISGLAQLVHGISARITAKLGISTVAFLEYVLNQRDIWQDPRLTAASDEDAEDEEENERTLEEHIADLDVALLALIEPLDVAVEEVAQKLDEVLRGSLWSRTLAHVDEAERHLQREVVQNRAEWLWRSTTTTQRQACFYSGLGHKPGVFLYSNLDTLVGLLSQAQSAIRAGDSENAANLLVAFSEKVMEEPFFAVRRLPTDWRKVLRSWVKGTAFADILKGRKSRDAQNTQAFVQDGLVFRLVWAVEAVRVQAVATEHPLADDLGDGPAFVLTYGVPTISAALLCQMGFSSRVGAVWATAKLGASFTDDDGLRDWLEESGAFLDHAEFWESPDHHLLWSRLSAPTTAEHIRPWRRGEHIVRTTWTNASSMTVGDRVRIIPSTGRTATVCASDLSKVGTVDLPFNPRGAALDARIASKETIAVSYFGPG